MKNEKVEEENNPHIDVIFTGNTKLGPKSPPRSLFDRSLVKKGDELKKVEKGKQNKRKKIGERFKQ